MKMYLIGFREIFIILSIVIITCIFSNYNIEFFSSQKNTVKNKKIHKMEYSTVVGESQYHPSEETIQKNTNYEENIFYVKGSDGKPIPVKFAKTQSYPIYYTPGSFPYGASNYIPNYEDAVKLSKINISRKYY